MAHSVTESALVLECRVGYATTLALQVWGTMSTTVQLPESSMIRTISSGYLTYLLKMNHLVGWFMMIYLSKWWFSCSLPIKMSVSCEVGTYQQPSTRTLVFLEDISVWAEFSSYTLGCIPAGKWLHYIYIYHIYIYIYTIINGLSLVIYGLYI